MKKNKVARADFNEAGLPKNRRQVFFDCIKMRYFTLSLCGVILVLFALPFLFALAYGDISSNAVYSKAVADGAELVAAQALFYQARNIAHFICIPALMFWAVGFAGTTRVIRQIFWGEAVFFRLDFKDGVKQNSAAFCTVFGLWGTLVALNDFVLNSNLSPTFVKAIPMSVVCVIFLPISMFAMAQTTVYKTSVGGNVKNAAILYLKTAPFTIIATIIALLPFLLLSIPNLIAKYLTIAVFIALLCPLFIMGIMLYCYGVFDKYINPEQYPEIVNKGIYVPRSDKDI